VKVKAEQVTLPRLPLRQIHYAALGGVFTLVLLLSFFSFNATRFSNIPVGTYVGSITNGTMTAQVGPAGIYLVTDRSFCRSGFFSFKTEALDCNGRVLDLELHDVDKTGFIGVIQDPIRDQRYSFDLTKSL